MLAVRVDIVRCLDDSLPGFVEFRLVDAAGRELLFHDKTPVVTLAELDAHTVYPQPGSIACNIVSGGSLADGRAIVRIDTAAPWHVETVDGETCFDVFPEQLIDLMP